MTANKRSSAVRDSSDRLVQSVQCYNPRPLFLHGYMAPFIAAYVALFYTWTTNYIDDPKFTEYYFIAIGALVFLQVLVYLFSLWNVHCLAILAFKKVSNPINASVAKVVPTPNNGSPEMVRLLRTKYDDEERIWFMFQKTKYVLDYETGKFESVVFPIDKTIQEYQTSRGYENEEELARAEKIFGKNDLEMDIPEFKTLFKERAIAPFFVFQIFCVGLWCLDEFWYYSLFTLFMLVGFESILVAQQLRNMAEIRKMGNRPFEVQVYRNRKWRQILSNQLVPGDIISIGRSQEDNPVPCDLILLRGSCIVDESMLTGESVPQMKESLENVTDKRSFNIDIDGKLHCLYGGTKIVQHTAPTKNADAIRSPDYGCVAYVLRTSFNTSQGKLLRTILFSVQRVTANNLESFAFILFLLIFAIAAATYVWRRGSLNPKRNRYKLMLECALILTSVVPPELPIELSLAVNASLTSLIKLLIFCTEPFRIPFAGKVDFCCFDKTGTLTSNNLIVDGIAGLNPKNNLEVLPANDLPVDTVRVLATCHSLVQLEDGLVGDPLEKACLNAIDWNLTKTETVVPRKGRLPGMKIFHRNYFSSQLKRMSVIAGYQGQGSNETQYFGAIKGAPEVLKPMFSKVPDNYDKVYLEMSRRGTRILALGKRELGPMSPGSVRDMSREALEKNFEFVGFLSISCPLKPDSKAVMEELIASSHYVNMITGDAPLTACHVGKELKFIDDSRETLILQVNDTHDSAQWVSIDEKIKLDLHPENEKKFFQTYNLCVTGEGLNIILDNSPKFFHKVLPHVRIFARTAPKQKEFIITSLRNLGFYTLMCGDGTNDVGALKQAHVGVALISNSGQKVIKPQTPAANAQAITQGNNNDSKGGRNVNKRQVMPTVAALAPNAPPVNRQNQRLMSAQERLQKALQEMEEMEASNVVKLGDASIAAPFTSKRPSIQSVLHIIRQGRCTLVTTLQMFKILALNALILAYCQSVLYLDGIKFSDGQATLQGLFLTFCFLFITRSQPLTTLSSRRPLPNIFNLYTILTVLLQFAIHFCALLYLVQTAQLYSPEPLEEFPDPEKEFKPSILNSTVYIISIALQVSTFAVNYKGHPFMCSLRENKPLLYSIVGSFGLIFVLVTGAMPEFTEQFSIVEFPLEFQHTLLTVLSADLVCAVMVDRVCDFLFGNCKLRPI